jgi:hypothetical protein
MAGLSGGALGYLFGFGEIYNHILPLSHIELSFSVLIPERTAFRVP